MRASSDERPPHRRDRRLRPSGTRSFADGLQARIAIAGRPQIDLTHAPRVEAFLDSAKPAVVINAAAYTAVDKAETDPAAAFLVNAGGPGFLAGWCANNGVPLIHISTDYVFDGRKREPYREDDARNPLSIYGHSKSAGEDAVRRVLSQHIIVRTAWVYSGDGQNFLKTMLRLGAERDVVRVIADQYGTPTSADDIARALLDIAASVSEGGETSSWGTYHLVAGGATTWHGLAEEIFSAVAEVGQQTPRLEAITTAEYPLPEPRPAYSVLDTSKIRQAFGIVLPPWQQGVAQCARALAAKRN